MRIARLVVAALVSFPTGAAAQNTPIPAFEIASVKPNRSGNVSSSIGTLVGNAFSAENAPLRDLIRYAYQLAEVELADAPEWTARERFDINARANGDTLATLPPGTPPERVMLRALLADRFRLTVHRETREAPIYALVVARGDRRLGPELRQTRTDCAALKSVPTNGPLRAADGSILCGLRNTGTGLATANALAMEAFARFLSGQVRRTVADQTGLGGEWDWQLKWTPDLIADGNGGVALTDAPNLFTALQEQLGLRLESTKGSVEVMVVDRVERPAAD